MSFSLRKDNCFNVELMMRWWKFYFRDVFLTFQRCETYLLMVKRKISMPMIFLKRHKNRIFCQNPGDLWWPPTSKIMFFSAVFRKVWWPLVTFFWWPHWWPPVAQKCDFLVTSGDLQKRTFYNLLVTSGDLQKSAKIRFYNPPCMITLQYAVEKELIRNVFHYIKHT